MYLINTWPGISSCCGPCKLFERQRLKRLKSSDWSPIATVGPKTQHQQEHMTYLHHCSEYTCILSGSLTLSLKWAGNLFIIHYACVFFCFLIVLSPKKNTTLHHSCSESLDTNMALGYYTGVLGVGVGGCSKGEGTLGTTWPSPGPDHDWLGLSLSIASLSLSCACVSPLWWAAGALNYASLLHRRVIVWKSTEEAGNYNVRIHLTDSLVRELRLLPGCFALVPAGKVLSPKAATLACVSAPALHCKDHGRLWMIHLITLDVEKSLL